MTGGCALERRDMYVLILTAKIRIRIKIFNRHFRFLRVPRDIYIALAGPKRKTG